MKTAANGNRIICYTVCCPKRQQRSSASLRRPPFGTNLTIGDKDKWICSVSGNPSTAHDGESDRSKGRVGAVGSSVIERKKGSQLTGFRGIRSLLQEIH